MIFKGKVTKESLIDEAFFNFVQNQKTKKITLTDATTEQGKEINLISFEVDPDFALAVVDEISRSLKPSGWYAEVESEYQKYIIFPNKVFSFSPDDQETKSKVIEYGKSLNIPASQLDI